MAATINTLKLSVAAPSASVQNLAEAESILISGFIIKLPEVMLPVIVKEVLSPSPRAPRFPFSVNDSNLAPRANESEKVY